MYCKCIVILFFAVSGYLKAEDVALTINELISISESRAKKLQNIQATITVEQEASGKVDSMGIIPNIGHKILIDLQSDRFYWTHTKPIPDSDELSNVSIAYDSEIQTMLIAEQKVGSITDELNKQINPALSSRLLFSMFAMPPEKDGIGLDDNNLTNYLKYGVLQDEKQKVNGSECLVVDWVDRGVKGATVWLDPQKELLPVRFAVYGKDNKVVSQRDVLQSKAFTDDIGQEIWLPVKMAMTTSYPQQTNLIHVELDESSVQINQKLKGSDFRVLFPPGTTVYDAIADLTFDIADPESLLRLAEEALTSKANTTQENANDNNSSEVEPKPTATIEVRNDENKSDLKGNEESTKNLPPQKTSLIRIPIVLILICSALVLMGTVFFLKLRTSR